MKFTNDARGLLERLEGCRLEAYRDQGGVWTIGYGHTGPEVHDGVQWTQTQADQALEDDLNRFCLGVERILSQNHAPSLTDNQFSALVIFAFNCGLMALSGSTAMKRIREGHLDDVPHELARWNKVHDASGVPMVSNILVNRRQAEIDLWNTPAEVA